MSYEFGKMVAQAHGRFMPLHIMTINGRVGLELTDVFLTFGF
jgi:hypothetical protein